MSLPSPWCTRREAKEYARVSFDEIDRNLVEMHLGPVPGKMRFRRTPLGGKRHPGIRILSADVLTLLPEPPADATQVTQ